MSTIRKRGDLQWECQIRKKGFPPLTKTFTSKVDAEDWGKVTEAEMIRGAFIHRAEAERMTLAEALERYEREVSSRKKGHAQERRRIHTWLAHKLAGRSLASLQGSDFATWRDHELNAGSAPATVRLKLSIISHLFSTAAKEWNVPVQNPVSQIRKPYANNARQRRLSDEEARYLLAAVDDPGDSVKSGAKDRRNFWMPALVSMALETAMRQGELLSLDWRYVDLVARVAHLPDTKNGTSRDVPLSTAAVVALKTLPRAINGLVFPTTESAVRQSWVRAVARGRRNYLQDCKKTGAMPTIGFLEDMTFHGLRHEATTRMATKLSMHELMKVTGHKDTRMLARYYHPRAEDLAKKLG
jgi:integrase